MKTSLLTAWLLFFALFARAQSGSISGTLADTVNYKPMAYSAVSLVRSKDSVLVAFQFAGQDGRFVFKSVPEGAYVLRISRPTFADYDEPITLAAGEDKRLGSIALISKANLLRDVIIREKRNAITIKGDTTEFLVDSFLTNKNSNVEDLLKKLPGIQVDKTGKITAQGQEVKKVLVDGEEFFGDDPTVATRNIKAENVESVQVFDKKSDQAAFTGIEDGEKNKTINLKLKEDAKKGYFGKVSATVGTQDRYEYDAMFNKFRDKQKLSAYTAASNTNKTGLSWEDEQKYGNNMNTFADDESGAVYTYYNNSGESFDGVGIPRTFYAGAVYSDKFKTDTHALNLNIKYQQLNVSGFNNNFTQYILPDTLYYNNQRNDFQNAKQMLKSSGKYEWKIDSLTTFKVNASVKQFKANDQSSYVTENLNGNGVRVNDNERKQTNELDEVNTEFGLQFAHRFKRKGRSLSIGATYSDQEGNSVGLLQSNTRFYEGGIEKSSNLIDQQKRTTSSVQSYSATVNYTEPLSNKWFIVSDFSSKYNVNESERVSLEKNASGEYLTPVDSLSNKLRYDITVTRGGLSFKYNTKKLVYSIGGRISYTDLQQRDLETNVRNSQYFVNLFPDASFTYKVRNNTSFSLNYNGRTRQPSLQQIQPIFDNTNPLDIYEGNPNLEQSFTNRFSLSYNNYKPVSGSGMYVSLSGSFTNNGFANFDVVDQFGRKIHRTVNVDGNKDFNMWGNYWTNIPTLEIEVGSGLSGSFSESHNFINGQANTNYSGDIGPRLSLYKSKEDVYELSVSGNWEYNTLQSTLRKDVVTNYWISTYSVYGAYQFLKRFEIGSDCDFNYRQRTTEFDQNFNTIIWNAYVSRKFLKSKNLELRITCNDLLNQNIGFRRNATSNYINENTYTVLRRYYMIGLTWNFSKGGAGGSNE